MSTQSETTPAPQRIHVIFKTHLDVGFTDFSARVVENYFQSYIPGAIALAETMRQRGSAERFVWTTGSWLIYEYLEQAGTAERRRMEAAIAAGDIAWHALPFTTHSELMDADLFRYGLSLSQALDRRFGRQTIAAKMTDVPGHTRGILPLLAEAGVQFLHIGVNAASTPPAVPPVFVWRDPPTGAEVVVMYQKGSYGDLMVVPGMTDAIAFAHTGDNLGPQSPEQLEESYRALRERFPGAEVRASTMDAFAAGLPGVRANLPVVEQEIGDTWIHGVGTDPRKVAHFRELLRWRRELLARGEKREALDGFHRKLLLVPEHTWGLDVKTHLQDWENYSAQDFQAARGGENFRKMEASWQEQRDYLRQAVDALPVHLRHDAAHRLNILNPTLPDRTGYAQFAEIGLPFQAGPFIAALDPLHGGLARLGLNGVEWAAVGLPLGHFWYKTFSAADYARFHRQYNANKRTTWFWAIPDFTKPEIDEAAPEHKTFAPRVAWAGVAHERGYTATLLELEMPEESWQQYGAPKRAALEIVFQHAPARVTFDLQWFEKPACRLPEALWFSFHPTVADPRGWQIEKLGQWIAPGEVIRDGNRHLHATGEGIRGPGIQIASLDAPLVAPGRPSLLDFNNRQPNLRRGFHFNLYNNLWGTNFPMWYEDDARLRFELKFEK